MSRYEELALASWFIAGVRRSLSLLQCDPSVVPGILIGCDYG